MRGMERRRASALCEIALASLWLATAPLFEQIWGLEYRQPSPLRELEQSTSHRAAIAGTRQSLRKETAQGIRKLEPGVRGSQDQGLCVSGPFEPLGR